MSKLNLFQKLVRQWESLHPYNGAQALKIRGRLDIESARNAWHESLDALGLGELRLDGDSYRYEHLNGQAAYHTVRLVGASHRVDESNLERCISEEINRPFGPLDTVPFRPFAIQENDHFWLGLAYRHWVADSASIRLLMREWFVRQFDRPAALHSRLRQGAGGYIRCFPPYRSGWKLCESLLAVMRWHSHMRRARRIENVPAFSDFSMRFMLLPQSGQLIGRLCSEAKARGVTVNDLFLAAIAQAADQHVPAIHRGRRRDLAIGSIVDIRPLTRQSVENVFDLLLGFSTVFCQPDQLSDWDKLLSTIAAQSRRQKALGFAQASWLRMLGGLAIGGSLSRQNHISFYRKRVNLAGAISNVNLNRCWAHRYHPDLLADYVRAAPTGPLTPLVFTTTTLGRGLSIGLTYRPSIVNPAAAQATAASFHDRLTKLAEVPPATLAMTG